jgi:hypothetical protein
MIRTVLRLGFHNAPVEVFKLGCIGLPDISTNFKMKFVTTLHLCTIARHIFIFGNFEITIIFLSVTLLGNFGVCKVTKGFLTWSLQRTFSCKYFQDACFFSTLSGYMDHLIGEPT